MLLQLVFPDFEASPHHLNTDHRTQPSTSMERSSIPTACTLEHRPPILVFSAWTPPARVGRPERLELLIWGLEGTGLPAAKLSGWG